jgi:hypothetical protein
LDYRNFEGYPDPTCCEALSLIEMEERKALRAFRPIIYVCSPYAGRHQAQRGGRSPLLPVRSRTGIHPIAPHLLFPQFLDDTDPTERELGLFFGNALMSKCAEVWVFGSRILDGMAAEIRRASWKGHRLRYFTEDLKEV